ncbi:MAG: bifunctional DNA-formamidopyrimidine glycosylase/DNA-(apurinic or apyrimidinic site) lyase [Pseudomonadota bacterium]
MPELPEVETTRRGIDPHISGQIIEKVILRHHQLRWPISREVAGLAGHQISDTTRRGKYLLIHLDRGHLIWHLGMSGSMRVLPVGTSAEKHEHVEIQLGNGQALKFKDPRRFGALLYSEQDPLQHRLLASLGPEPLGPDFTADYLYQACRQRTTAIKQLIMNSNIVVGVGNIYASEALFDAGIRPALAARRLSKKRVGLLVDSIRKILAHAIQQGGTTLQDFTQTDGKPGYFSQSLQVYGNRGDCLHCGTPIKQLVQGQRSSYYCPDCQS